MPYFDQYNKPQQNPWSMDSHYNSPLDWFGDAMRPVTDMMGLSTPNSVYQAAQAPHEDELTNMYLDSARGMGPSVAQMQLQRGTDRNMQQAMAFAASQRGANPGMMRQVANQRASIAQGMTGDAAMLRLQEQLAARAQLASQIEKTRQAQMWTQDRERETRANQMGFLNTLGKVGMTAATGNPMAMMGGGPQTDPNTGLYQTMNPDFSVP
jgi:hypothetical protein